MRVALAVTTVVVVLAAAGCPPPQVTKDRTPPRVISVDPGDPIVAVDVAFFIGFTEDILADTVVVDPSSDQLTVALVPRALVTDTFLTDFANPGILESRQLQLVPVEAQVTDSAISFQPSSALTPRTAYTLLLGSGITDANSNPLVDGSGLKATFRYDFQTDDGQPAVVSVDTDGAALIAPNRRRITVTFNQPVQNVGEATLTFEPAVAIDAILLDETRTVATVLIGEGIGCSRFVASTLYTLVIDDGVVGDTGQTLAPFTATFTTGGACDTVSNTIVDGPDAIAGELAATLRFESSKQSTTEVRCGVAGGPLDCLGASCPVLGNPARVPVSGSSPPRFLHSVEIAGLQVNVRYDVVVSAEDDVGNTATGFVSFLTAPLPRVGLNEVMANPPAVFSAEAKGEYVEITNFGDVDVDVSGWLILVEGGDEGGGCTAVLPEGLILAPAGFLVVAGKDFDAVPYSLDADVVIARLVTPAQANGMCSLVNSRAQAMLLADSDARPVSSISGYSGIVPDNDGRSVERTDPAAADVETSFCFSRVDAGPTPGRANSVLVGGCD